MKEIELTDGTYSAQWGLTDFYDESYKRLCDALDSGEDFRTSYGCKKEIRYCEIVRENGSVTVTVTSHMDDLYDGDELIYDALWERCKVEEAFDDDIIESIRDAAIDEQLEDYSELWMTLPYTATIDDICEAISKLENETEGNNTAMFNKLCDIVEEHYKYIGGVAE